MATGPHLHVLFEFKEGPWGGGNQFLKALASQLRRGGRYAESADDADVIVFNSHHQLDVAIDLRNRFPDKAFIHRVDGPIALSRGRLDLSDRIIFSSNAGLADGTVFQSEWSRKMSLDLGLKPSGRVATILNAPDPAIFGNKTARRQRSTNEKVRLVSTSWSTNPAKGFDVYQWLDAHLDFSAFEYTFVGNSPVEFRNIGCVKPLDSQLLADVLRESDVFITASRNDACSNSLLEAMHSGLPALAVNSGGNPEIVGTGGLLFDRAEEIPDLLRRISASSTPVPAAALPDLESVAAQYEQFASAVFAGLSTRGALRRSGRPLTRQLRVLRKLNAWLSPVRKLWA